MADDKKKPKDEAGKKEEKPKAPAKKEEKPKAEKPKADKKKDEKPKDEKKPKDDKKGKESDEKEEGEYDPNAGAVEGSEVDDEGRPLDPKKAAEVAGGKPKDDGKKDLHRVDDDKVPHPLKHEEVGASQPVVDGTVTAAGGAPGQPTEPTVPGQSQQVPSQPKVVDALGGGVPVQPDAGVAGHAGVNLSPGESGPTGKLPIA